MDEVTTAVEGAVEDAPSTGPSGQAPDAADVLAEVHEAVRRGAQANDAALNVLGAWLHGKPVDAAELERLKDLRGFVSAEIVVFVDRAIEELAQAG